MCGPHLKLYGGASGANSTIRFQLSWSGSSRPNTCASRASIPTLIRTGRRGRFFDTNLLRAFGYIRSTSALVAVAQSRWARPFRRASLTLDAS